MLGEVGDQVEDMINARGRSPVHIAEGLALVLGAVVLSAMVASHARPDASARSRLETALLDKPRDAPPPNTVARMWPVLSLVLTLSGLRIWNAPQSPARSRALGLWAGVQGLNAVWMAWSPRQQSAQLATTLAALGAGICYANEARKVDGTAAALVSPYLGWSSLASLLTGEIWRRNRRRPTIH